MRQRGRKSTAALAVVTGALTGVEPIQAPAGLTEAERVVWRTTVQSKPADWFGPEHIPVMVEYVRHACRGHVIDARIKALDDADLDTPEGMARFERLTILGAKTAGVVVRLATNLRLTHQSTWRPDRAANIKKVSKLWQRSRS